jgi:hypothetical protein
VERQELLNTEAAIHSLRVCRKETTSCQGTKEARLNSEKPISADMKACQETTAWYEATERDTEKTESDQGMMRTVGEHHEVPKGDAAVMPVGGLRKRRRVWKLAAEHRQKPKERTGDIVDRGKD